MALGVGALLAIAVGLMATGTGLDRDRAFYPVVTIVVASIPIPRNPRRSNVDPRRTVHPECPRSALPVRPRAAYRADLRSHAGAIEACA